MPPKKGSPRKTTRTKVEFKDQLVRFLWLLDRLDAPSWDDLPLDDLKKAEKIPWTSTPTPYLQVLTGRLFPYRHVTTADLEAWDARIWEVTEKVNRRRETPVHWKYFQYLSLLFTELWLDRYFQDREALRSELNAWIQDFNGKNGTDIPFMRDAEAKEREWVEAEGRAGAGKARKVAPPFMDDLASVAFWQATGSGKTLLLHANYYQYMDALDRYKLPKPDNVLLVTPNVGLSRQHHEECRASGIAANLFKKDRPSLFGRDLEIVEITRFSATPGPETVSVKLFEGRNLVFVDEGHRGAANVDGEWRATRQRLAAGGFCFEYSATFAQAASKDEDVRKEYARSILFDYSYHRFYRDGYGKHWRILNVKGFDEKTQEQRAYLTGALLVLYQQLRVYDEAGPLALDHNLERPFCIFVGASVTGGKEGEAAKESAEERTDILTVLHFLAQFVQDRAGSERILSDYLLGRSGLRTQDGKDVFSRSLPEVPGWSLDPPALYLDMVRRLFNADGPGLLHVQELKEAEGELSVSVGNADPFAVVNVGDVAGVRSLCEAKQYRGLMEVRPKAFMTSLFEGINRPGSPLTMLIGSRKFTEGWSSWRVSEIGLLNLGRSQGTQIIQLFGRGVRLKGKDLSLKRSSLSETPENPGTDGSRLRVLETLSIFGIRADYMEQFREQLKEGGVEEEPEPVSLQLPVVRTDPLPRLRVVRMPARDYPASGETLVLSWDHDVPRVYVDAYPRVQYRQDAETERRAKGEGVLLSSDVATEKAQVANWLPECFRFLDHEALYADLVRLKNQRGWSNLSLPRRVDPGTGVAVPLSRYLLSLGWYEVAIPPRNVEPRNLTMLPLWQQIASDLVRSYTESFYQMHRQRYQTRHAEIVWFHELPESEREKYFPHEYEVLVGQNPADLSGQLVDWIGRLALKIRRREFNDTLPGMFHSFGSDEHLYQPLVQVNVERQVLRVTTRPVSLNDGERLFVEHLGEWVKKRPSILDGATVYLLRNESRKGIGFFEIGGFYPDFILWTIRGGQQWVTFVDPKGLRMVTRGARDPKINLWKSLRHIEERHPGLGVMLDSWIVSVTPRQEAHQFVPVEGPRLPGEPDPFEDLHIVFQDEPGYVGRLLSAVLGRTSSTLVQA